MSRTQPSRLSSKSMVAELWSSISDISVLPVVKHGNPTSVTPLAGCDDTRERDVDGNIIKTCHTTVYGTLQDEKMTLNGNTTGPGKITPLSGFGYYVSGADVDLNELNIATTGDQADAIMVKNNGRTVNIDRLNITTAGSSAEGINIAKETYGDNTVTIGDNANIDAQGMGVRVNTSIYSTGENKLIIGEGAVISSHDAGVHF